MSPYIYTVPYMSQPPIYTPLTGLGQWPERGTDRIPGDKIPGDKIPGDKIPSGQNPSINRTKSQGTKSQYQ